MKKIAKKLIALSIAFMMAVGVTGTIVPTIGQKVCAAETTNEPKYMAKLTGAWTWVYQSIQAEADVTYKFTCDYYVEDGGSATACIWRYSSSSEEDVSRKQTLYEGTKGTVDLSYTADAIDNNIMIRFEGDSANTVCYVWNISLTKEGSDENLLTNGNFEQEDGTWIGWRIGDSDVIMDKDSSNDVALQYRQEIISYDKGLLSPSCYMAKLEGTYVDVDNIMHTYVNVSQTIKPTEGTTYTFRCNYYDRAEDGGASVYLYTDTSVTQEGTDSYGRFCKKTKAATEGILELSYTANEDDTQLSVSLECDPESESYFWGLSLTTDADSETNLLTNADFQEGNGSWIGWTVKGVKVSTDEESQIITNTYGHQVVEYTESRIESMKEEDALLKTYEDPNALFQMEEVNQYKSIDLINPTYMARLNGTYTDSNGQTKTWIWVYQGIVPEAGTKYQFLCDYYVAKGDAAVAMWSSAMNYNDAVVQSMAEGERGTAFLTYTANPEDETLTVRFECSPGSICYIRDVRLVEENSDDNLFRNGDFSEGNGSWIGWKVGGESVIADKSASDVATSTYGQEILVCDWELFSSDLANWSVRPQVKDTLDFTYQAALKAELAEGSLPYMDFVLYNENEPVKTERVTGVINTDGNYQFSLEILPQQIEYQIVSSLHVSTVAGEQVQMKQYSVKEYCISILKNADCSNELKNLIADMMKYSGESESMLGKTKTIADELRILLDGYGSGGVLSDITDALESLLSGEQTEETYRWKSASLILNGKVTIRLKFAADDIKGLTVQVNHADCEILTEKNGAYYYVDIPMSASEYNKAITANFQKDGNTVGKELQYSVHTYLYRMKDHANSKNLLQAIYRYGQSAAAYASYLSDGNQETEEQTNPDTYLFTMKGNSADRMNPQSGGADAEARVMRESIMNADDNMDTSGGTVYYISAETGDDANDGISEKTAWKTLAGYRTHAGELNEGDTVLFERGGVYRGEISEHTVLPLVSGVTYGAYGIGAKPAIYGSKQNYVGLGSWIKTDTEHIWVCSANITSDAGCIVFNHGQAVGVKRLKVSDDLATNLAELKDNFEFYHDLTTEKLYLYMDCDPSYNFYDIEICQNSYMLLGNTDSSNITIDNLSLKYSGGHAIRFHSGASNITITNCDIGFIGGSLQLTDKDIRYGNGIEFWNGCADITIKNNWIYQIYDAGFTHQGGSDAVGGCYTQENINFSGNLVEYCSFSLEFWAGNPDKDVLRNIIYEDNVVRFNGYGWGVARPTTFGVASVNVWGHTDTFTAENFVIRNNIFDLSAKALIVSYYDTEPNVTYSENSYYLKEGYVAFWEGKKFLAATDQSTMEASVATVDKNPKVVQFIEQ